MSSRKFPERTLPPERDGSTSQTQVVSLLVPAGAPREAFEDVLRDGLYLVGHEEVLATAVIVVADVEAESVGKARVESRIGELRQRARADAALILVGDDGWPPALYEAAEGAGAFACVAPPIARADVQAVIDSASANYAAQTRIADPTLELDLHTHLASLGRFTGGLHHELKNPLAVVEMNVNLVRDEVETLLEARKILESVLSSPPAERREREQLARDFLQRTDPNTGDLTAALDDARSSLGRMRDLFERLRKFVHPGEQVLEAVDLQPLLHEVAVAPASRLEGVDVEVVADEPLFGVAVRSLVREILVNLAANAGVAARSLSSPRVRLRAYASGEHAVLSVRDNGPGIPAERQAKIFDPFYTTYRSDGAAGLGLAICREYATHMGAELSFWTAPGRGACFRLHLRRA